MHRLKEPIKNKGTQEDQDAIIDLLANAVQYSPSPVLRMEAIVRSAASRTHVRRAS